MNQGIAINPETPMRHTDSRAAHAARTAQTHAKRARLQQLADDHLGHDPYAIHWGHVGDLGRVEQALDDLLAIFDGQPEQRRPRWKLAPISPRPRPCCCVAPPAAPMGA